MSCSSTVSKPVADRRSLHAQHVAQARQLLRKVLADRLTVTPEPGDDDRYATITGDGTFMKILIESVFPKGMASPARDLMTFGPHRASRRGSGLRESHGKTNGAPRALPSARFVG